MAIVNPSVEKCIKRLYCDQWCLGSLQQMHVHPIEKKNDEQGLRSVVCCLQIPVTDFKHCGYNAMRLIGCYISCLLPISNSCNSTARACCNVCSCRCLNKYTTSFRHCYNFHALVSIGVEFVGVQPGFLQRLLTQNEHN